MESIVAAPHVEAHLHTGAAASHSRPILIVEDHPLVAEATSALIRRKYTSVHLVLADTASAALKQAGQDWFRVFLDLDVPGASGLSLVHEFVNRGMAWRCCVITATTQVSIIEGARALGLLGYITKTCPVEAFHAAIDHVMNGRPVFHSPLEKSSPVRLTRRQQQVLVLLQKGLSSKQVAHGLGISEGTVNNLTSALLRALQATNRAHAITRAIELGFLSPSCVGADPPELSQVHRVSHSGMRT